MNTDATTNAEEYYRPTWHKHVHDVFDYSFHLRKIIYAFHVRQIVYALC
jgi:hypothetical protein